MELSVNLYTQAMRKKLGELEWSKLSEKEKQHRLIALLAEEKRLRIEGRDEEAAALLGDDEDQKGEVLGILKHEPHPSYTIYNSG